MTEIDESSLGPARTAIVPEAGTRAVHRGPIQLRMVPAPGAFDAGELLDTIAGLGIDVAGISREALEQFGDRLPALMEQLLADEEAAARFDADPAAFRDVLGDELVEALTELRRRVTGVRSAVNPPGSDQSTRRPARRVTHRLVTARDPAVEERADALREDLIRWAVSRRPNLAALERSPEATIEARFPDEPEAVRRALLRGVQAASRTDA
jgi:hypothetical protein